MTGLVQPYWLKITNFSYSLSFSALAGVSPFKVMEKLYRS